MRKERTDLPRFQVGDQVCITTTIMSRRSMQEGKIISVQASPRAKTLDKYIVSFQDDSSEIFWDIQLAQVPMPEHPEQRMRVG